MPRRRRRRGNRLKRQVYKNKKFLKKLAKGIENKVKIISDADVDVNTTGAAFGLNAMKIGTAGMGDGTSAGYELRLGNSINVKRITIKGCIHNDHGTPEDCVVRLILARCKVQNNVSQTHEMLLGDPFTVNSLRYPPHINRFQILYDKTFAMDTTAHSIVPFYSSTKVNTVATYSTNTGTMTDIERNGYYFFYFSNIAGTTNNPQMDLQYCLWFEDA